MRLLILPVMLVFAILGWGQGPASAEAATNVFTVDAGTKIPLTLIKGITTKTSAVGDRVYLETAFPIVSGGRIVIPPGSYVAGTVTQVKRPARVKGRGELYVRFDSLVLPNGVTRDFRSRVGSLDADSKGELDRGEGTVQSEGGKAGDARAVGEAAGWGTMAGGVIGRSASGAGIGAAAGAAAGLIGVLATRGPEAVLERGTTLEMILDRNLKFTEAELEFGTSAAGRRAILPAAPKAERQGFPGVPRN